ERLMRESPLTRAKWDHRPDYLRGTILKACAATRNFYNDGKGVVPGAPIPATNGTSSGIGLSDFYAYLPQHAYIFVPTREVWPAAGVDGFITPWPDSIKPSAWLDRARPVHQMIWVPGAPMIIADTVVADGGWIRREGANTFNLYREPIIQPGDANKA